ncbi:YitT family protein [Rossellomorea marisflavi]|uniref:YczE/YyaS/YitT family protein n=1 Tax=Rossellomorea marisflavi TaxID=189381 RepID=UPI003458455E
MKRERKIRWGFFFVGLIIMAFGITLTIKGKDLGIGPWDVLHYGLFLNAGLSIGAWSIIAGIVILSFTGIMTKSIPKLGAFINMLLVGIFIDIFNYLLPDPSSLWIQAGVLCIGIIIMGIGIGIYVAAGLGAGPRDSLMLLIVDKTGWRVQWVRNGMELVVLIAGWLLGGPVGIGTIVIALGVGQVVGMSLPMSRNWVEATIARQREDAPLAG